MFFFCFGYFEGVAVVFREFFSLGQSMFPLGLVGSGVWAGPEELDSSSGMGGACCSFSDGL